MANKTLTMLPIKRVLQLLNAGLSQRKIAKTLGISRNTVQDYCLKFIKSGLPHDGLLAMDDHALNELLFSGRAVPLKDDRYQNLAPQLAHYSKELGRTGVTRLLLWKEYCGQQADPYSYQQFCLYLGNHQMMNAAVMHFEHAPGGKAEIDFAGKKLSYVDKHSGEIIECPVLVCVLVFSGYTYVEALPDAGMIQVVASLNRCMQYFGGVPVHVVSDNMKQTVKSCNRYEPSFTELIDQWSLHYDTTFLAARVRKPRDKATVEKAVDIAYKRVYAPLRDTVFHSLEQLNEAMRPCLENHNHALMQKKEHSRYDLLVRERENLKRLPALPFELKYAVPAKVQKNYHVTLGQDWHHYSVPFRFIGRKVKIVYDTDVVEIYDSLTRIACHKRNYRKHSYSTVDTHMPDKHLKHMESLGWNAEYFLEKAEAVGENFTKVVAQIINSRHFTEQTYNACLGLIRLKDKYGKERLEAASQRALLGSSISYRSISNILVNGTDRQTLVSDTAPPTPLHDNIRGPQNYN
jgi:transposase